MDEIIDKMIASLEILRAAVTEYKTVGADIFPLLGKMTDADKIYAELTNQEEILIGGKNA